MLGPLSRKDNFNPDIRGVERKTPEWTSRKYGKMKKSSVEMNKDRKGQ